MASKVIAALHEAKAIAAGDQPAAAIMYNGHRYLPAARIEALEAEKDAMRKAAEYALEAINTGRSEPLFVARDLIRNTLDEFPSPPRAAIKQGERE